jgi:hypothetical protein
MEIVEDEHVSVPTNTNANALFQKDKADFFSKYMADAPIASFSSDNVGEHAQRAHRCLLANHQKKNVRFIMSFDQRHYCLFPYSLVECLGTQGGMG